MEKRKIGIIGLGHVGAHCAYSLALQGIADELVLVDQNQQKAVSERQDLFDSVPYLPHRVKVEVGDFCDLGDCALLINSVGNIDILRGNHNRTDEMDYTIRAVNGYMDRVMNSGFNGVIINITNPCDVVTERIARLSGLPRGRVFGTGTGLDTARLKSALAQQTGFAHTSVTGYMLGEHGASQMAAWSSVSFGGKPLSAFDRQDSRFCFDRAAMEKEVIGAGWVTFSGKFCTEYGISATAARLASAVLRDEKQILPVSAALNGEYGEQGLFAGVPAVIGASGAETVLELPLTQEELTRFHACCTDIRNNIEAAEKISAE